MNPEIKTYIESGILEAYVLGTLSAVECADVQAMAMKYVEIRDEIETIENSLKIYAEAQGQPLSPGLKDKVMAAIEDEGITRIDVVEDKEHDPRNKFMWSIAASFLLFFSMIFNIYLYKRALSDERDIVQVQKRTQKSDSTIKQMVVAYNQAMSDMAVLKDPMYKIVEMKGQPASPESKAMVCFCPGSKLVYFSAEKMTEPPKGMQYQLWAIVDGKPVSEGMITMTNGLHKMKDVADATAFAVTLEKEGGSDTPHGDMIVMGSI
jgi:anti-sigma-K factor RskA